MTNPSGALQALRETAFVAAREIREMLLGMRVLLLVSIYGGTLFTFGALYVFLAGKVREQLADAAQKQGLSGEDADPTQVLGNITDSPEFKEALEPVAKFIGGEHLLEALTSGDMPWIVGFTLITSTIVIPGLVILIGFDRISEDLSTKFTRFLFQRIRRGSYLAGKVIGLFTVSLIAVALVHVIAVAAGAAYGAIDAKEVLPALPRVWVGMAALLFGYACLATAFSAAFRSPFLSLAFGAMFLMSAWVMSFFDAVKAVWMGNWDMRLWVLDPAAIGVYAAHGMVFIGLAYALLRWRDV